MSTHNKCILIVGQTPDIHIETVCSILKQNGSDVIILDRGKDDSVSFKLNEIWTKGYVEVLGQSIDLNTVSSVWWRVKPSSPVEFSGGQGTVEENMKWAEWKNQLCSLPVYTQHAFWINSLTNHYEAAYKPIQLYKAKENNFNVPNTVISNNPKNITPLFDNNQRVIYKTLSSFLIPPDEIIYTNEIFLKDVVDNELQIKLAPGIFQEFIDKQYELRVTVVGEKIFPVKIMSQNATHTKVDWRRDQMLDMYEETTLDSDFEAKINSLHRDLGLFYAAYDFVVDKNNEIFFLECNPGGQWLWLENALNLTISEAIADALEGRL